MDTETYFFCQACDSKLTVVQLVSLDEGRCPSCGSIEGYSTVPKSEADGFEQVTMVNDSEMLSRLTDAQ
jgi:Zn finger protein HypA/HybF involved in hydrogenase expression